MYRRERKIQGEREREREERERERECMCVFVCEREGERERGERSLTKRLVKVFSLMTSLAIEVLLHWSTADIRRTTCNLVLPRGGSRMPTVVCITPI